MTDDPETALLAAVQADPDDANARDIYADWLEQRGDPRGEYLRLEVQRRHLPGRLAELALHIDPAWIRAIGGRFQLAFVESGPNKINTIKAVREVTGLGLRECVELVDGASADKPAVLFEELDLARARAIIAKLEPHMTLRFEPSHPAHTLALFGPSRRTYRVRLTAVGSRSHVISALHQRCGRGLADAVAIFDRVLAGESYELASGVDAATAAELAVELGRCGTVQTEYA